MTSCSEQGASFLIESFANDLDTALKEKKEMLSHLFSSLLILSAVAFCDSSQPPDDACFPKMRAAYEAYAAKGKNGLIEYLYTDYLTGTSPGVYCYTLNGTDASESLVVGTYFGNPTAVPGEVSLDVSLSLNKTREDSDFALGGWNYYYDNAADLCCGPDKAWLYCSPVLRVDGCSTSPTYSYINQTNVASIFSSGGEKGDGTILCACQLGANTSTPFSVDKGVVQQVIAEATSGSDQLAFAPALAQAPVIEPNDDACFAKVAAAYEAYKNNGLRGNEDSLIPHLYKEYLNGTLPGLFCYQVDVEDVAESIVVGTYLGGIPGETQFAAENRRRPTTQEELEDANGAWPGYISDENLCCGPEKSFYYCSPILGKSRNITACSQEPQYTSKDATTLATRFSDGTGEDRAIFCGCVMDQDTTEAITLKNNLDPVEIEKVIQQYSTSGTLLFSGTLTVLVASAMATLL